MNYKKTYVPAKGYTPICKIGQCSLKKLEFGIIELDAGEKLPFYTEDKETAFIMLEGHCDVTVNGETWENIGNRSNVFENRASQTVFYRDLGQADFFHHIQTNGNGQRQAQNICQRLDRN